MAAPLNPPSLTPVFQEPEPAFTEPKPGTPRPADPARESKPGTPHPVDLTWEPEPGAPHPADPAREPKPGTPHPAEPAREPEPGIERAAAPTIAEPKPVTSGLPVVIVDGANVVGSVPDGWWRDRAGAAARLRDNLAAVPSAGLPGLPPPIEVILVLEGKARNVPQAPGGVRIERAPASGDDEIVDLVRVTAPTRRTVVITADRGLRDRVTALGAEVRGPSTVPR